MNLRPFRSVGACPKCTFGRAGTTLRYCTDAAEVRNADGEWISARTPGDSPLEHLHVRCTDCGYEWRERCADA